LKPYTQVERLIMMLSWFSSGRRYTSAQLFDRFDSRVHIRTIQRDLKTLQDADVKLKWRGLAGNEREWWLEKQFSSNLTLPVGMNEYFSALIMKDALKVFKGTQVEDSALKLVQEIDQMLPDDLFDELESIQISDVFENIDRGMYDYSAYSTVIQQLIVAITKQRKSQVKYLRPHSKHARTYEIEPRKIVQFNGAIYVDVYYRSRDSFITLALHRIQELKILEEKFHDQPKYDSTTVRRGRFGLFPADKIETIELKFSKEIAYHIDNRHWGDSQEISTDKHGNLILKMKIGVTPELVSWILSWGKYCTILHPASVSENIQDYY